MRVLRIDEVPEVQLTRGMQRGTIGIKALVNDALGARDFKIAIATFPKGARSVAHIHAFDQVHLVLSGRGIIADEEEEIVCTVGMLVFIAAGERHWHGATADSAFTHLSIMGPKALQQH
jgi:quercetin dioxygenase-like cupin family protein